MPYKIYDLLKRNLISLMSFVIGLVFIILLFFFIDINTVFESLKKITLWQFGLIFILKLFFLTFGALKWKIILDFYRQKVPLWKLYLFRFAVFAGSYFTPVASIGGQPIGVLLLKNEKVPVKTGVITMLIDSVLTPLISFIVSFIFLVIFLLTKFSNVQLSITALIILLWLIGLLILFFTVFKIKQVKEIKKGMNFWSRWVGSIKNFLFLFSEFFRKNKKGVFSLIFFNLAGHAGVLLEIFLILYFLGTILGIVELAIIETGYSFAFITPIPQALGTAEASGAYIMNLFGHSAALGVSLTLVLRLRHLLIGLIGIAVLVFYGLIKLFIPRIVVKHD